MVLEWYRRRDPTMDAHLKEYLFSTGSIVGKEQAATGEEGEASPTSAAGGSGSLGIGSLKGGQGL